MASLKQKKAINALVDTNGNVAEAMRRAGYAPSTVNQPAVLTQSKAFKELFEEALPDKLLIKRHKWLVEQKDYQATAKGLDMAYKLKGEYAPDKSISLNVEAHASLTPEQIAKINEVALDE